MRQALIRTPPVLTDGTPVLTDGTRDATPFVGKSLVVKPDIASQEEHDQGIAVVPKPVGKRWEDVHELKVGGTST